jgi:hypothetical protein
MRQAYVETGEKPMQAKLLAAVLALVAFPALAQSNDTARYQLISVSGGFVRLDMVTGVMTFCRDEVDSFRCAAIPVKSEKTDANPDAGIDPGNGKDASRSDRDQPDGMTEQDRRDDGNTAGRDADRQDERQRPGFKNDSSEQDFDRALSMMERAMKSFMAMSKENRKDCEL